jgi:hypothetical protein
MTDAPINLNRFRKAKARSERRAEADQNAVRHGRTKAERSLEDARQKVKSDRLEGHRRDDE